MLFGHFILLGLQPQGSIHKMSIGGTVVSGAVGGAIWAGAALAFLWLLRTLGADREGAQWFIGCVLTCATLFVAPPIGVHTTSGTFHGHILSPALAMGTSVLAAFVLGFITFLIMAISVCVST